MWAIPWQSWVRHFHIKASLSRTRELMMRVPSPFIHVCIGPFQKKVCSFTLKHNPTTKEYHLQIIAIIRHYFLLSFCVHEATIWDMGSFCLSEAAKSKKFLSVVAFNLYLADRFYVRVLYESLVDIQFICLPLLNAA